MIKAPEMDKYNALLGERYDAAMQGGDLDGQRMILVEVREYLASLQSNHPMYGDHQGGFCLASELMENVDLHIKSVEEKLIDAYHDELQSEHELQIRKQSHSDWLREDHHREMMKDCYGIDV